MFLKHFLAVLMATSLPLMAADLPTYYEQSVADALKQMKSKGVIVQDLGLSEQVTEVRGTKVGHLNVQLAPNQSVRIQLNLSIGDVYWTKERFQEIVIGKVMHQIDVSVISPTGLSLTPTMAIDLLLKDLARLRREVRNASIGVKNPKAYTGPALNPIFLTFNEHYMRALLAKLGKFEVKLTKTKALYDFAGFKLKSTPGTYHELKNMAQVAIVDLKAHVSVSVERDLLIRTLGEVRDYAIMQQTLLFDLGEQVSPSTSLHASEILKNIDALTLELTMLKEYQVNSFAARYSDYGRWTFREKVQGLFQRLLKFEKGGIRLRYTLAPLEAGSRLAIFQESLSQLELQGINREARVAYGQTLLFLEASMIFERTKLQAHLKALETLSVEKTGAEWKGVTEQLKALEFQLAELEKLKTRLQSIRITK